jgi:hypothetical protein
LEVRERECRKAGKERREIREKGSEEEKGK